MTKPLSQHTLQILALPLVQARIQAVGDFLFPMPDGSQIGIIRQTASPVIRVVRFVGEVIVEDETLVEEVQAVA